MYGLSAELLTPPAVASIVPEVTPLEVVTVTAPADTIGMRR